MQFLPATPPAQTPDDRIQHRLATANLVIAALARYEITIYGDNKRLGRLEQMPNSGMRFIPATAGGLGIDLDGVVQGKERLLPGFRGSHSQQQLLRALATYVRTGEKVGAAVLAQAMMGYNERGFERISHHYDLVLQEFRFAGVFAKPRHIHPKTGPSL